MSIKDTLKKGLMKKPKLWGMYIVSRDQILRITNLRYHLYDIKNSYNHMNWLRNKPKKIELTSKLLFQYHKLEKGLVMPGEKRVFGLVPAQEVMRLITTWEGNKFDKNDKIYQGALGALKSYRERIYELEKTHLIIIEIDEFLSKFSINEHEFKTPVMKESLNENKQLLSEQFDLLMLARSSVRNYLDKKVPEGIIRKVVRTAQFSPSACNRQPWTVDIITDEEIKSSLLSLQNGNLGFGHLAPHVAVISCDESAFFGTSERHEPYIDGGLFSMSLILAMESHGISSCCLNWCVNPKKDIAAHDLIKLDSSKRIIMLISFGYAPDNIVVPRSTRKDVNDVLNIH